MNDDAIRNTLIQFVPFVMAVVFHEFAHGYIAKRWGDNTAMASGRMTLNPLPHIDLMGTIIFPLLSMLSGMRILFGWAKPVPIDPRNFKNFRKGLFWVSFAGPLMNLILAFASALVLMILIRFVPRDFVLLEPLVAMTQASVFLNVALAVFNLLPMPPLDGSKMIQAFLSPQAAAQYESIAPYSFFILIGLAYAGVFHLLQAPIVWIASGMLGFLAGIFGAGTVA